MIRDAHHLRAADTSVVVDLTGDRLPAIVHWGELIDDADVEALVAIARPQRVSAGVDAPIVPSILPTQAEGWTGTPGIEGSWPNGDSTIRFRRVSAEGDARRLTVVARDAERELEITLTLALEQNGLLTAAAVVRNQGTREFRLSRLDVRLPVPADAEELLHGYGRHLRERAPQRQGFAVGSLVRESRTGKPGYSSPLVLLAGRAGFGFERGRVHGVHLAWSGSSRFFAERTADGARVLGAGEVLAVGEVRLAPGEEYASPPIVASWGDGMSALSARIHQHVRERRGQPMHPPVTLNTWEAVYFDQSLEKLLAVLDAAADVGVERLVLDDGWFLGRRDDTRGLGDWTVDPHAWPEGLRVLSDAVHERGMQFGLWVEPEMISPDSELARRHPEWILSPPGGLPMLSRQQQVLNLAVPEAAAHILERLDALVGELGVDYLKWDHNRDLLESANRDDGRAAGHANVVALYALLDELRSRHPELQIEACAGGGGRIDLALLDRSERVWVSDCIDPLERLVIQKYTSLLLPPELMGNDIGEARAHSTHRVADLGSRAGVAMFGALGIQWDLSRLDETERRELSEWIRFYKEQRDLVANGRLVFADLADRSADVRGMVAADGSRALYSYTQVTASESYPPDRVRLPGLAADARYRVRVRWAGAVSYGLAPLAWAEDGVVLSGRALASAGVAPPVIYPEQLVLLYLERVD